MHSSDDENLKLMNKVIAHPEMPDGQSLYSSARVGWIYRTMACRSDKFSAFLVYTDACKSFYMVNSDLCVPVDCLT